MPIKGEKIYLRAMEPEDLDLIFEVENSEELWQVSATNVPVSRFAVRNFIANTTNDIYADKQLRLMACIAGSDAPAAIADLTDFNPRHSRAEVGIAVMPGFRGKGIATDTLRTLSQYARQELRIRMLYAVVPESNAASLALFDKAGYSRAAVLDEWLLTDGKAENAVLFEKMLLSANPLP